MSNPPLSLNSNLAVGMEYYEDQGRLPLGQYLAHSKLN